MNLRSLLAAAIAIGAVSSTAKAQNDIVSWGDGTAGTHWNIVDNAGTIEILRGDGLNYKFYAQDASQAQNLGVINNIMVATGATGDFTLLVQHPSGAPGALHWRAGNLTYAGGTSTLLGINIADRLCSDAFGTSDIVVENIVDDIRCVTLAARVGSTLSLPRSACVGGHELVRT